MANQYTNKVILGNETLIDLTSDTVTASDVASGVTFHLPNGQPSVGTATGGVGAVTITDTLDSAGGTIREITTNPITLETLSVISNGTYSASSNYAFNVVNVEVEGSGGITADEIAMRTISGEISGNASYIKSCAFMECGSITAANFSLCTAINDSAFCSCSFLSSISFPLCETIGSSAFYSCYLLTSAIFPSCSYVSSSAFYNCSRLTTASFNVCKTIYSNAFSACYLLNTIYFPSCSIIYAYAFTRCSSLTTANFPSLTSASGTNHFDGCVRLKSLDFPLLSSIAAQMFYSCSRIPSAYFPSATYVGQTAFCGCSSLSFVELPLGQSVGSRAFQSCYSLGTVILGYSNSKAGSIYSSAFHNCRTLLSLYLLASSTYTYTLVATNVFNSSPISNYVTYTNGVYGKIFVPESLYSKYSSATNWAAYYSAGRIASLTDAQVSNVIANGTHVI